MFCIVFYLYILLILIKLIYISSNTILFLTTINHPSLQFSQPLLPPQGEHK